MHPVHRVSVARIAAMCVVLVALPTAGGTPLRAADPAAKGDIVIINGHIYSHAPNPVAASALLIRGGKFVVVGGRDDVIRSATPGSSVINLSGWYVYPGLHDAHSRLGECGPSAIEVPLEDRASTATLLEALRDSLPRAPRGGWVLGTGWDPRVVSGTRATLDSVSAAVPIMVRTRDGHAVWLNGRALELLGVKGCADGVCREAAAFQAIERWVNSASVEQVADGIERAIQDAGRTGVTSFHDASPYARSAQAFALLARKGRLRARVVEMPMPQLAEGYAEWTKLRSPDPARLALGPDLVMVDGTLTAGTAAVSRPYRGIRDGGSTWLTQGTLDSLVRRSLASGRGVSLHASGDRGVHMALDALDHAGGAGALRGEIRLERAELVAPEDAARIRARKLTVVFMPFYQPTDVGLGTVDDTSGAAPRLPYPMLTITMGGTPFVVGTDATPGTATPGSALERMLLPVIPEERPAAQLSLYAFTVTAARSAREDSTTGTIETGKRADMAILDRDPLRVPPTSLHTMKALFVTANGEIVHRSGI